MSSSLLRELQNYNSLLNDHQEKNVGSHQNKISHVQGQRSPSKMVGVVNQTPDPPEMLRGLRQTLCTPGSRHPTETEPELCLSVSCRGMGQQWPATGARALGAVDLGMV